MIHLPPVSSSNPFSIRIRVDATIASRFSLPSSSSGDSSDSSDTGSAYAIELNSDPLTLQPLPPSGLATYTSPLLPADSVDHNLIYVSGNTDV
ncbi:hypothetical protein D9758_015119 [Tetrapyrgos nigripes]|uniref:Uncharacterized protein n=1 Tax=Tetrapyrgos nigripes TaxID=182062 RepID=A0A8H5FDG7_9AGAR|nr:hypothetical protein D9758_015129 [Tetrapyrgos nigripes]KAF5332443.1 hypothetical protein D9758_015119 [Tetrapyrgos nigripes]